MEKIYAILISNHGAKKSALLRKDTTTLNASLRDNLTSFCPGASDKEILEALSLVHLDKLVRDLPDQLDTVLGEGAVVLGGQKQRIALARALIKKPNLLLLDEATSALDNETERDVQNAINLVSKYTTIVIIAHRLSTVRRSDKIVVMDNGKISETGTYDELMSQNGLFAKFRNIEIN